MKKKGHNFLKNSIVSFFIIILIMIVINFYSENNYKTYYSSVSYIFSRAFYESIFFWLISFPVLYLIEITDKKDSKKENNNNVMKILVAIGIAFMIVIYIFYKNFKLTF